MPSSVSSWFDHWFNKYAVLALSATVGLFGYEWVCWSGLTASDWGTWVAAIGTVGTLIGTIVLASRGSRKLREQELLAARLHAITFGARLRVAAHRTQFVIGRLRAFIAGAPAPADYSEMLDRLLNIEIWSTDELIPLAPLGDVMVLGLAAAAAEIRQVIASFDIVKQYPDMSNSEDGVAYAEDILPLLSRAHVSIRHGLAVCAAAQHQLGL